MTHKEKHASNLAESHIKEARKNFPDVEEDAFKALSGLIQGSFINGWDMAMSQMGTIIRRACPYRNTCAHRLLGCIHQCNYVKRFEKLMKEETK